jgi:hypothetical protein
MILIIGDVILTVESICKRRRLVEKRTSTSPCTNTCLKLVVVCGVVHYSQYGVAVNGVRRWPIRSLYSSVSFRITCVSFKEIYVCGVRLRPLRKPSFWKSSGWASICGIHGLLSSNLAIHGRRVGRHFINLFCVSTSSTSSKSEDTTGDRSNTVDLSI